MTCVWAWLVCEHDLCVSVKRKWYVWEDAVVQVSTLPSGSIPRAVCYRSSQTTHVSQGYCSDLGIWAVPAGLSSSSSLPGGPRVGRRVVWCWRDGKHCWVGHTWFYLSLPFCPQFLYLLCVYSSVTVRVKKNSWRVFNSSVWSTQQVLSGRLAVAVSCLYGLRYWLFQWQYFTRFCSCSTFHALCEYTAEAGPLIQQAVLCLHLICCLPVSLSLSSAMRSWSTHACSCLGSLFLFHLLPAECSLHEALGSQAAYFTSWMSPFPLHPVWCILLTTSLSGSVSPWCILLPHRISCICSLFLSYLGLWVPSGSPHLCSVSSAPVNLSSVNDFKVWRLWDLNPKITL